jgi:uncharacterized membrane protein YqjE
MTVRPSERDPVSVRPTDGIVRSGRRMLAILVSMARTRLNLLAVELIQEKNRLWLILVLTALALIFASMALLALSLLLVVAFGEGNRLLTIGCLSAFYVVATIVTLVVLQQKTKTGSSLFAGTLGELSKDSAALTEEFEANDLDFDVKRWPGRD